MSKESIEDKMNEASGFYVDSFLKFDFHLAELNFRSLKPFFKGKTALELGPASGFMTKKLVDEFETLHIVEGSEYLLERIPNYDNVVKHHSMFEDFNIDLKFDTITMGHVLEHIANPVDVLKRIKNWLSDEGVFLVSVPNAKSIHRLAAKQMGLIKSEYDLNERDHAVGHYRVYDMDILKQHMTEAGLRIMDSGGIFFKPLTNKQIDDNWTEEMVEGFYQLGNQFPEYCGDIFVVCSK